MNTESKNRVLSKLAKLLDAHREEIISQNQTDISNCNGLDDALMDRLKVDHKKVDGMIASVNEVKSIADPEGEVLYSYDHPDGMQIENRTVPFGNILIIYESRPDVTIEAAVSAFKAGNKILLKGGKEARLSNLYLVRLWHDALISCDESKEWVTYLDMDREATQKLIAENTHNAHLIIPRGGDGLINYVRSNTNIPLIVSGRGNNFVYIHDDADFDMAVDIVLNGKSRLSVCNATDKVLINKNLPELDDKVSKLNDALTSMNIAVHGDQQVSTSLASVKSIQGKEIWDEEFLSADILLGLVDDEKSAIEMINQHSGGHSGTIVTSSKQAAELFQKEVDCAAVYHNASTRYTDGGQFGFGAEIAISTQKLHFRGPIGLGQLITNKWFISGSGQTR